MLIGSGTTDCLITDSLLVLLICHEVAKAPSLPAGSYPLPKFCEKGKNINDVL